LNQKLASYVAKLKRLTFGPSSEKLDPDQLQLGLEDLEQKIAEVQAEAEKTAPDAVKEKRTRERRQGRPSLPDMLPEMNVTIEPDLSGCPCCQGPLHRIGEDVSSRLDIIRERPVKPFSLSGVMGEDLELRPALMPALCLDRVVEHVASGDRLGR
jgi:hypothetical protein